jgi:metallo-beta-lactamase family protein
MKDVGYYDSETLRDFLGEESGPFAFKKLTYITSREDSKKLNTLTGSAIIIASSGMCQGGRIRHHLYHNISDARNFILVVGFMAQNTLGRRLVDGERTVKIFGDELKLKAEVVTLNEFSAHADKLELLNNIKNIAGLKQIFVVHGEESAAELLRDNIYNLLKFRGRVTVPKLGEEFIWQNGALVDNPIQAAGEDFSELLRKKAAENKSF